MIYGVMGGDDVPMCGPVGRGGGGELRSGGVESNCEKLRENCGNIAENCGKLRKNCDVVSGPPEPSRCNHIVHNRV